MIYFLDKDIVDIIHEHPNLKNLSIAIANANFIPLLRDQKENFTFFAPNDSGFGEFNNLTDIIQNDKDETFEMLSRHKIVGHGAYTTDRIRNHN